jgi:hypothetical protein
MHVYTIQFGPDPITAQSIFITPNYSYYIQLCIHENDHIYLRKNIYKKCEMGCDVLDAMVVRFTSTYVGLLCP